MVKLSVQSLWLSSVFILLSASVQGDSISPLGQEDLVDPSKISAWLLANKTDGKKADAEFFYKEGLRAKKVGAWGAAGKGFGASAQIFPAPKTLIEYANARLNNMSDIHARAKNVEKQGHTDMRYIESLYRSAVAADTILNTLSKKEKKEVRKNVDCLAVFVQTGKFVRECPPLQAYGLK